MLLAQLIDGRDEDRKVQNSNTQNLLSSYREQVQHRGGWGNWEINFGPESLALNLGVSAMVKIEHSRMGGLTGAWATLSLDPLFLMILMFSHLGGLWE